MVTNTMDATLAALKKKYATAEELKASSQYASLGADLQTKALSVYAPVTSPSMPLPQTTAPTTLPGITDGVVTPPSTTPGITDAMKNTQTYKNLLSKGYSEQQISDAFTSKTKLSGEPAGTPTTPPTTPPATNLGNDPMSEATPTDTIDTPDAGHPDYQDTSATRLEEMVANLNSYKATTPNLFTDKAKYKEFFHYNERSQAQKDVLDNYFSQHNTPSLDLFGGLTESQIGDGYLDGTFTDNDLLNLKNTDPNKRQLIQTYINNQNTYNDANGNITGALKKVKQILGVSTAPEDADFVGKYDEYLNTPEIKALNAGLATKKGEIETIDQQIADMRQTTEDQYTGTGMNKDIVDAIAADRMEALTRDKTRKEIAYNTELNKYNGLVAIGEGKYQAYKDNIEQKRQERQDNLSQLDFYYGSTPEGMLEMAQLTGGGEQEILTKDFGTTKAPNRKQSLDGGKTRQNIEGIGGYGGGGGGGNSSYSDSSSDIGGYKGEQMSSSTEALFNWTYANRIATGGIFGMVNPKNVMMKKELDYLKNNMTLNDFLDLKGKGATFGAMANAERDMIKSAATKLSLGLSDADWQKELNKIRTGILHLKELSATGTIANPVVGASSAGTTNNNNTTNNNSGSYGLNFGDIFNM